MRGLLLITSRKSSNFRFMRNNEKENDMARCDNCLANKVCDHNRFGFENCGSYISAADVAPKSEVDNLFMEIEAFIEVFISNDERIYNRDEDEFYDGRFSAFTIVQEHIAELKKKYTEEKTDG